MQITALVGRREDTGRLVVSCVNTVLSCDQRLTVIDLARDSDVRKAIRGMPGTVDYFEVIGSLTPEMLARFLARIKTEVAIVDCSDVPEEHRDMMERLNATKGDLIVIHGMDKTTKWVNLLECTERLLVGVPCKLLLTFETATLDEDGIPDPDLPDPLVVLPLDPNTLVIPVPKTELPAVNLDDAPPQSGHGKTESGDEWRSP